MSIPEFSISLKMKQKKSELKQVTNSAECAAVARECFDADKIDWIEECIVIALNNAGKVMGFYKISVGGITSAVLDPRVVFQFALLSNATRIILVHNHPSGQLIASREDYAITQKIKEGGKLLDIHLLDHIILTSEGYLSLADLGEL